MDNFAGAAKRLDDIDLPKIGALIGVGEDELHAFMDVETSGSGFDRQGRPKMLFEPHIFYRLLSGKQRQRAVKEGLAYANWGERKYPKDSYDRLIRAMKINRNAALKSASWGLGQILGNNHLMAGYASVSAMVHAFMADEENHLRAIVKFLISSGIDDDLRNHDWAAVARVYNGSGYRKNRYAQKMAAAFRKWSNIRDTPVFETGILPKEGTRAHQEASGKIADVVEHLRDSGSRTLLSSEAIDRATVWGGSASAAVYAASEFFEALKTLPSWTLLIVPALILIAIWVFARRIKGARIEDHIMGRHIGRPEMPDYEGTEV